MGVQEGRKVAEIVSEDVMEWARDLEALRGMLAGEQPRDLSVNKQAVILHFTKCGAQ